MIRRVLERAQSALWWTLSLALVAITIAGLVMLVGDAPDWSIYRAGGYNPIVKMAQ